MSECNVVERWNALRNLAGIVELRNWRTADTYGTAVMDAVEMCIVQYQIQTDGTYLSEHTRHHAYHTVLQCIADGCAKYKDGVISLSITACRLIDLECKLLEVSGHVSH